VGAFFLVSAVLGNPLIKSMFETKVLVLFGKLSFVIYVLHLPVLMSVGCGVFVLFGSGLDLKLAASLSLFSTFTVTFVLSFLAYKLVDLPAQILANRFSDLFIDRTSK